MGDCGARFVVLTTGENVKVYQAIGAVSKAMSHEGISKARKNTQQGYNFRGIDDVLNTLSGALVEAGLVILPRCVDREVVERTTAKGNALFYVTCRVEFDLVSTEDGSKHTVCTYGEAMDSADKATNKAMSAAYKYLALLVFCIPTESTPDADQDTHEVAPKSTKSTLLTEAQVADWIASLSACDAEELEDIKSRALAAAENAKDREAFITFRAAAKKRHDELQKVSA
jgi:hypothetical protein